MNVHDALERLGEPGRDGRAVWEKPVLLPLDVGHSEGNFTDVADEDDFKTLS